jgi:predicted 3-demethylubiquinone-9 3-methyltransferase (glyoxalase superfamily)
MARNTICLWYDKDAEAAARFYSATFPDSAVGVVHRAHSDYPSGKEGYSNAETDPSGPILRGRS